MILVRTLFLIIWIPLVILITLFSIWRKLRLERVGDEDKVIDKVIIAALIAIVVGRLGYIGLHWSTFGADLSKWLSLTQFPGTIEVFALLAALLAFWKLLGNVWRDTIEVVDYISISLALYLGLGSLANIILQALAIGTALTQSGSLVPMWDWAAILTAVIYTVFYLLLFVFLGRIEKQYRTFMWYRARRRSAQTGFIVASLLIGYGLIGFILGWLQPATLGIAGINLDPLLKLLVMVGGFVILYLRSGHTLFNRS